MSSLSRLALVLVLPLLAACTVYTPAEYRSIEESRSDSTRMNRAAADSVTVPMATPGPRSSDRAPARAAGVRSHRATPAAFTGEEQAGSPAQKPATAARSVRAEG